MGGCFDIIHIGHIRFLKNAKTYGDVLIVALESDEFVRVKKKRHPLHTQDERAEVVAALSSVDYVVMLPFFNSEAEYMSLVEKIAPRIIAITKGDPQKDNKKKQAQYVGGYVVEVLEPVPSKTSSRLLEQLAKL